MHVFAKTSVVLLFAANLTACGSNADPSPTPSATDWFVTVVGDATVDMVVEQLEKNQIRTSNTLEDQADSSLVIVVQDAAVGPIPIHSQIAKSLKQRPSREFLWLFTNTSLIDDQELLELEELECREIFNNQGLPGDSVSMAFDSAQARVAPNYECLKGWEEIVRHIRQIIN